MGATPLKAVTNCFPQAGGNQMSEAPGEEGVETHLPNDSSKASLSPPVGDCLRSFRRVSKINKCSDSILNIITNGYILPFISKPKLVRAPLIHTGYQTLRKEHPVSSVKERNRKVGKCKISRVLQSPVSSPQASPKVEASDRLNQAQLLPTCRKVQNGNTRVH